MLGGGGGLTNHNILVMVHTHLKHLENHEHLLVSHAHIIALVRGPCTIVQLSSHDTSKLGKLEENNITRKKK